jgi:hypothetical protein
LWWGVEEEDLGGDLDAAGEGEADVGEGDREGVAVGDDEAALGGDDEAGAAEADVVDAVDLVGDRDVDGDQRGDEPLDAGVVAAGEGRGGRLGDGRGRRLEPGGGRPQAGGVVAGAAAHAEPAAVHGDDGDALAGRGLEVVVADRDLGAGGQAGEDGLGGGEVGGGLAGDGEQDGAALELEGGEEVAGVGDVDPAQGDLGVAGALVGEVVEDAAADLEEVGGG